MLQVGTGTAIVKTRQIRNEFLDAKYRLQLGRQNFYEQNEKTVYEIEDMMGELHGEEFRTSIADLKAALSTLSENPDSSLNDEVSRQVDQVNSLVSQIRDYNKKIQKYEATGQPANDYRDKRNHCLDELATIINFETNESPNGTITIYSEGAYLLDDSNQYYLETAYESETSRLLKPVWASGGEYYVRGELTYSSKTDTDVGSLKGILVSRGSFVAKYTDTPVKPDSEDAKYQLADGTFDQAAYDADYKQFQKDVEVYNDTVGCSVVMTVQSQIDMLVHGIVTKVNDALCPNKELTLADGTTIKVLDEDKSLIGDDKNSTIGTELFARRSMPRYEKTKKTRKILIPCTPSASW